jgi:hypothetical protein
MPWRAATTRRRVSRSGCAGGGISCRGAGVPTCSTNATRSPEKRRPGGERAPRSSPPDGARCPSGGGLVERQRSLDDRRVVYLHGGGRGVRVVEYLGLAQMAIPQSQSRAQTPLFMWRRTRASLRRVPVPPLTELDRSRLHLGRPLAAVLLSRRADWASRNLRWAAASWRRSRMVRSAHCSKAIGCCITVTLPVWITVVNVRMRLLPYIGSSP